MAEDLDDGEFWLPSHFLTDELDDDTIMDFNFPLHKSASASNSDLDFTSGSTETESSDDEDILLFSGFTPHSPCPVHSPKGYVLSSSPQSTLCGCVCNQGSSRESLSGPVSPPPKSQHDKYDKNYNDDDTTTTSKNNNPTLDLLNKAAGEVARLKIRTEKKTGTGFFDCSKKGVLRPAPIIKPGRPPAPTYLQPQLHHFSPMHYYQPKPPPPPPHQQRNKATKNNNNANRPLGLPPSAWPPLHLQAQTQTHSTAPPPAPPTFVVPKRECTGTGVFLPRVTTLPLESRKKSDGNATKSSKSGKTSQSQQSNHRRNARSTTSITATTVNPDEIQLPQEWTY